MIWVFESLKMMESRGLLSFCMFIALITICFSMSSYENAFGRWVCECTILVGVDIYIKPFVWSRVRVVVISNGWRECKQGLLRSTLSLKPLPTSARGPQMRRRRLRKYLHPRVWKDWKVGKNIIDWRLGRPWDHLKGEREGEEWVGRLRPDGRRWGETKGGGWEKGNFNFFFF